MGGRVCVYVNEHRPLIGSVCGEVRQRPADLLCLLCWMHMAFAIAALPPSEPPGRLSGAAPTHQTLRHTHCISGV